MRKRGFTLIELLVVIAIIAILMAIGMPALSRANDDAFRSQCEARLQLTRLACQEHAQDFGAYPEGLGQLVERGYLDEGDTQCSKTGQPFFYRQPRADDRSSASYWLSCMDPDTPAGQCPHGAGTSLLGVTEAGEVKVVER